MFIKNISVIILLIIFAVVPEAVIANVQAAGKSISQFDILDDKIQSANHTGTTLLSPDGLAQILSDNDKQLYLEIFALQHRGKMKSANVKIKQVQNRILMGHVLYQRYMHPTAYRSSYNELKNWLRYYADHPGASNIYKIASRRGNARALVRPKKPTIPKYLIADTSQISGQEAVKPKARVRWRRTEYRVYRTVKNHVRRERPTAALKLIKQNRKKMSSRAIALSLAHVSKGYFLYGGLDNHVIKTAEWGIQLDKKNSAPELHWWLAMAEWREGNFLKAAHHFKTLSEIETASDGMASRAAFWASRAYIRKGFVDESLEMLHAAADNPFDFYGQLANETLGYKIDYDWHKGMVNNNSLNHHSHYFAYKASKRALALYQIGDVVRSSKEFRAIVKQLPSATTLHYIKYMNQSDLASVAFSVGRKLKKEGVRVNAALFPVPRWQPEDGFRMNPALIFGFMRQESTFKPNARSVDGASGLMQLMPATARFVARKRIKKGKLFNPEYNMSLGQRYIEGLMKERYIKKNLFFTAVSYNGGPGNFIKWKKKMDYRGDPLLFLETIPAYESRHFANVVVRNYWIYSDRFGKASNSRAQLARGEWPMYEDYQQKKDPTLDVDGYALNGA